jgi:nitrous oxide reductase accessory protein NosL
VSKGKKMSRRDFIVRLLAGFASISLGWTGLMAAPPAASVPRFPKPGKKDRCPVCGMFAYKYPQWIAGFVFKSGKTFFHCCPKCMLHNLSHIPKYQPGETREQLKLIWVTEYYTTRKMAARDVLFVAGTQLVGPMGLDLIPVKGEAAADSLKRDYGGGLILTIDQITPEIIERARRGRLKP